MKKLKKWAALVASVIFAMLIMPRQMLFVSATENAGEEVMPLTEDVIASGIQGDVTWVIDRDGKLTVSGSGDCYVLSNEGKPLPPWYEYRNQIKSGKVSVTNMIDASNLFRGCSNLTNLDLSKFDTTNVENMSYMFRGCSSLTNLDLSKFDTTNVENMSYMFRGCSSLTNLDLSKFDTTNVESMYWMFVDCSSLTNLDLSNFSTSNVVNMGWMFYYCGSLTNLNLSKFDTTNVENMQEMFRGCSSLTNLDLSNFDTSNLKSSMAWMFDGCSSLTNLDLSNFDISKTESVAWMFRGCSSLTNLNLSNFNTTNVESMAWMFYGCSSLTNLDLSKFDTSKVKSMAYMFDDCSSLRNLDLSNFDTSKVESMQCMFSDCSSLTNLDLSNFDTSKVEDMESMFFNCSSLINLDLSNFDTLKVEDMRGMFRKCSGLNSLNLSSFNLSELKDEDEYEHGNYSYVFTDCNKLSIINTPYNLTQSIRLPATGWHLPDGTAITELPKNLNSSVIITRQSTDNKDDNNQNNNNNNNSNNDNTTPDNPDSSTGNTSQDKPSVSDSTGEDHNTQNNFWNTGGEQNGAISGVLEGSANPTDVVSYGTRKLTTSPHTLNTILLSWDSVPAAKSYEIFYSTSPDSGFKRLANVKKTFYKFSKAKCGVTYYFQMRVCQKGVKSEFGPISYAKTALTGSTTLQVKKTTYNSVQLKWSKVPGAKKYEIFCADSMGGKWQSLGIKGGTSFTHKKLVTGATYYYQIRPVRDFFYGTWSNGVSSTTALGDVNKLKVKAASADRMKVNWKKVKGATQYVILRAESIDGTYEVVGHANKTSYIDTGLKSGTTYFYKVYAVSGPYRTKETAPVGQTTKIAKK